MVIYDVGAGKRPFFSPEQKRRLGLRVCGLDISRAELDAAPAGSYDEIVCADIAAVEGKADGDLVICQAVLEHVSDTARAMAGIASLLRSGGKALIFVPCRNALFARLNLLLPHEFKKKLLFALFPGTESAQGFRSLYDRCTPSELRALAASQALACDEMRCFYMSTYLSCFAPLYFAWRLWTLVARAVSPQLCESFSLVLRKRAI